MKIADTKKCPDIRFMNTYSALEQENRRELEKRLRQLDKKLARDLKRIKMAMYVLLGLLVITVIFVVIYSRMIQR
ncbi:hypothetical protein JMG10_07515 [Nostoc ellipsosporum NOK]|nr:hypothetical protein [Nostoc ellipsosporum NOK]